MTRWGCPKGTRSDDYVSLRRAGLLGSVTAAEAVSFYTSALPRAGYTIMTNSLSPVGSGAEGALAFRGHGYHGTIVADSVQAASGTSAQNIFVIQLTPQ